MEAAQTRPDQTGDQTGIIGPDLTGPAGPDWDWTVPDRTGPDRTGPTADWTGPDQSANMGLPWPMEARGDPLGAYKQRIIWKISENHQKIAKNHKNQFLHYRSTRNFMVKPNLEAKILIYI